MSISLDEVRHVSRLARLELDETELLSLQSELSALIGHFVDIQAVDVTGVAPMTHPVTLQNVWSEDIPGGVLPRDVALKNTALQRAGLFVVPQIIED
jgi:aspartyl-tRNA(Asn)/glutamyl-tRNA(Gln) amidotransferase subunit C